MSVNRLGHMGNTLVQAYLTARERRLPNVGVRIGSGVTFDTKRRAVGHEREVAVKGTTFVRAKAY